MLSSIVGVLGAHSQANYAAGNTYKDALARYRVASGEKAVSIDLGMMVTEGVVTETEGMLDSLRRLGWFMEITQPEFLALLDIYCNPELPLLNEEQAQIIVGIDNPASMETKGIDPPEWINRPLFRHHHLIGRGQGVNTSSGTDSIARKLNFEATLRRCATAEEAVGLVTERVLEKVAQIMGNLVEELDEMRPLHTNGINSLSAVELRNWFDKHVGADVTVFNILGNMSIRELSKGAVEKSRFCVFE